MSKNTFSDRVSNLAGSPTPADRRVIEYLVRNRETALFATAIDIAQASATSDATVIRTVRKLGYDGLDALRQALAEDLRRELTLSQRMSNELERAGDKKHSLLSIATKTLRTSLDTIDLISNADIGFVTRTLAVARRLHIFGIGPSGYIAGYFATQLVRLGFEARALIKTGVQCADDLVGVRAGDAVIALSYDRPYPEVTALFDRVQALDLASVLITSTGPRLPDTRASLTLRVPRGRTDGFGLHAGTLALLEGLLIACAAETPEFVSQSLDELNEARRKLSGDGMEM